MKKILLVAAALAIAAPLSACYSPGERALGGAAIGGLGGAGIGALASGGRTSATLGGAAIGAAAGGLLGAATAPGPGPGGGCARWGWDYYGNRICQAYY